MSVNVVPLPSPRESEEARAIAGRLVGTLDDLLPALGTTYRNEIDGYARLSDSQLEAQVLATSRRLVEGYFGRLAQGRDPARVDLTAMELVGRRRLEMGLSLDDALHAFRLAAREVWRALAEVIEPGEEAALVSLASGWIERLDQVSSRVAEGYLDASHDRLRRLDGRRHEAVDALLGAADDGEVAAVGEQHAIGIARAYQPLVVLGEEVVPRADAVLAAAPGAFVDRRGDLLLVMLPIVPDVDAARTVGIAAGDRPDGIDLQQLAALAHAELIVVGRPVAPGRDLAEEVRHTRALADLVRHRDGADGVRDRAGTEAHVVTVDELPFEELLIAAGPVAGRVAGARLGPLDGRPELLATLDGYLDTGSIPAVASQLAVHPNTVAHRLRRVRERTGLDPRIPRQAAVLAIALAAEPAVEPRTSGGTS